MNIMREIHSLFILNLTSFVHNDLSSIQFNPDEILHVIIYQITNFARIFTIKQTVINEHHSMIYSILK